MFEKLNSLEISEYLGTMQNLLEQGVAVTTMGQGLSAEKKMW